MNVEGFLKGMKRDMKPGDWRHSWGTVMGQTTGRRWLLKGRWSKDVKRGFQEILQCLM